MRILFALIFGLAAGLALGRLGLAFDVWPVASAEAEASPAFQAIAVSAAPAGANTTQAWFVGRDGSARVCFSTGRASQCSPVAY